MKRKKTLHNRPTIEGKREVLYTFNPGSLDAQFSSIHSALETQNKLRDARMDSQDVTLSEIKDQCLLTNGRVTVLERDKIQSSSYRAGSAAVVAAIVSVIVPILGALINFVTKHFHLFGQ